MIPLICERTREIRQCGEDIANRAYAMLEAHNHFRGRAGRFQLVCQEDVLVVRGVVASFYLKQVLQTVLRDIDGVSRSTIRSRSSRRASELSLVRYLVTSRKGVRALSPFWF